MSISVKLVDKDTAEIRHLKWQKKQLAKQCGKQGQTIYELRCQLAEMRGLIDKRERGELRVGREVRIAHGMLLEENYALRQRVNDLEAEKAAHELTTGWSLGAVLGPNGVAFGVPSVGSKDG